MISESRTINRLALAFAAFIAACGNYSNEDIEFQLALPDQAELTAKLPQTVDAPDAPEYYLQTRVVVFLFNGIQANFLGLIDHVRAYPATSRAPRRRVWGPFPDDKHHGWSWRVIMERAEDPTIPLGFRFAYWVQLRPAGAGDGGWIEFISGHYLPGGGARRGEGELRVDTRPARAAGFPIDDPMDPTDYNDLEQLQISYRSVLPIRVTMDITYVPGGETASAHYEYRERADGAGSMLFSWPVTGVPGVEELELQSRWLGSGAGRADARVSRGLARDLGLRGTDCWGLDGRATYSSRDWQKDKPPLGTESACIFLAP